jgi:hypothetical protein
MTSVTIAANTANRLRRRAQRAAVLPEAGPDGWSVSPVSPMGLVAVFDTLRLKPGMTLHAYQYRAGDNGNGVVWAMPEHVPLPPPDACPRIEEFLDAPKPHEALDDVMEAIDGDGSPISYLSASLLARELREFGARWHGVSWGACRMLGRRPATRPGTHSHQTAAAPNDEDRWTWLQPAPAVWPPRVIESGAKVTVKLHVLDPVGAETIRQLTDTYRADRYTCTTTEVDLAIGGAGIIW